MKSKKESKSGGVTFVPRWKLDGGNGAQFYGRPEDCPPEKRHLLYCADATFSSVEYPKGTGKTLKINRNMIIKDKDVAIWLVMEAGARPFGHPASRSKLPLIQFDAKDFIDMDWLNEDEIDAMVNRGVKPGKAKKVAAPDPSFDMMMEKRLDEWALDNDVEKYDRRWSKKRKEKYLEAWTAKKKGNSNA